MSEPKLQGKTQVIPKHLVWDAWLKVKRNGGAAGADGVTIEQFEQRLKDNLYRLWNRMTSGSYFPGPVRAVEIPKKGRTRILGIPNVVDRVAQSVAVAVLEPNVEKVFHDDSFGYLSSTGFDGDQDLPRSRVLSGCGVVVLGLELNGRDKADLAVKAAVIEPVDVLGDRDLQVVDGPPRAFVADEFGLEQAVERLGHGVVIRVALAAHGGDRAGLEQALGVADGDVLHAAIGVVHQRGDAACSTCLLYTSPSPRDR